VILFFKGGDIIHMKGERVIRGLETHINIKGIYIEGEDPRRVQSGGVAPKGYTLLY
jgi:hypothetical protein